MTKTFCDNCGEETKFDIKTPDEATFWLRPSMKEVTLTVSAKIDGGDHVCVNCYLTALHGAFKQPQPSVSE